MTIHWKAVEEYFTVLLFVFQFVILENLSVLDLALSGAKGLKRKEVELLYAAYHIPG